MSTDFSIDAGKIQDEILDRFFALKSWAGLDAFLDGLGPRTPFFDALRYYAESWAPFRDQRFEPRRFLTADHSSVLYGRCPVIFQGSNRWAETVFSGEADFSEKLDRVVDRCTEIRKQNRHASACLVLVPEKDFLISRIFLGEDRFAPICENVETLRRRLAPLDIALIFDEPLRDAPEYQTLADLEFPDTHLSGQNYLRIFLAALAALGFDPAAVQPRLGIGEVLLAADLHSKYNDGDERLLPTPVPSFAGVAPKQVSGDTFIRPPLGDLKQSFINDSPIFDDSVTLLGDSHSSLYVQQRLTYLFAFAFRETSFAWNPAGTRGLSEISDAQNLLLEISSRFLFTRFAPINRPPVPDNSEMLNMLARAIWRLGIDDADLPQDMLARNEIFMSGYPEHRKQARRLYDLLTGLGYDIVKR